jgi:hypothetical protein
MQGRQRDATEIQRLFEQERRKNRDEEAAERIRYLEQLNLSLQAQAPKLAEVSKRAFQAEDAVVELRKKLAEMKQKKELADAQVANTREMMVLLARDQEVHINNVRKQCQAELDQKDADCQAAIDQKNADIEQLRAKHAAELDQKDADCQAAIDRKNADIEQLRAKHAADVENLRARHEEKVAQLKEKAVKMKENAKARGRRRRRERQMEVAGGAAADELSGTDMLNFVMQSAGLGQFFAVFHEFGIETIHDLSSADVTTDILTSEDIGMSEDQVSKLWQKIDELNEEASDGEEAADG